jgi:hypothetical protein
MDTSTLKCYTEKRRQLVRDQAENEGGLNGIDYVEIVEGTHQQLLCVHFFGGIPSLVRANVRIEGGSRIRDIQVVDVQPHNLPIRSMRTVCELSWTAPAIFPVTKFVSTRLIAKA